MPFDSPFGQFMTNVFGGFDQAVFSIFGHIQCDLLTWINILLSSLGTELFVLLIGILGLVLCLFRRTRMIGLIFCFSAIFVLVVCGYIINPLANRMRPYNACQGSAEFFKWYISAGTVAEGPYSFPSKHTAFDFSISVALLLYFIKELKNKKFVRFGWVLIGLALLVSLSRIYLMVHYPTDVVAGIFIGCILGVGAYHLAKLIVTTLHKWRKPFHWLDKIDLEPWLERRLGRPINNKKGVKVIIIVVCVSFIMSAAYLIYGINGGEEKCQYRGNEYVCMNKADKQILNEDTGEYENRCKIHKH